MSVGETKWLTMGFCLTATYASLTSRALLVIILMATAPAFAQLANGPLNLPELEPDSGAAPVTVTWYGVSTLLFDDGQTKLLVDGFVSRPASDDLAPHDLPQIRRLIATAGLESLAAVAPTHSHWDHAMDAGVIAKLTGAMVIGSESTANIARGADVPEDQIEIVHDMGTFEFGSFTLTVVKSNHRMTADGRPPFPGVVDTPLVPPTRIPDWKEGGTYAVHVAHPEGRALVNGSAGFIEDGLEPFDADVVFLTIGGLQGMGREYTTRYWQETVEVLGARCVSLVHWDDLYAPFGVIEPMGGTVPDAVVEWLRDLAQDDVALSTLPFGVKVNAFPARCGGPRILAQIVKSAVETATGVGGSVALAP